MNPGIKPGAVVFTHNHERLAQFYAALAGMEKQSGDDRHTLLTSDAFELVLHNIPHDHGAAMSLEVPLAAREDACVKLIFPVRSIAEARVRAESLGGRVYAADHEWEARGIRYCDGLDPDGNVVQFRERVT